MIERLKAWIESLPFIDDRRVWWHYEDWRPWSIGIDLEEGALLPLGYGVAWRCPYRLAHRCYPVPLNLALAGLRSLWRWASHTVVPDRLDIERAKGYAQGRTDGFNRGYEASRDRIERLEASRDNLRIECASLRAQLLQLSRIEVMFERVQEEMGESL